MGCSKILCGPVREATGVYKQEAKGWGRQDRETGKERCLGTKVRQIMR